MLLSAAIPRQSRNIDTKIRVEIAPAAIIIPYIIGSLSSAQGSLKMRYTILQGLENRFFFSILLLKYTFIGKFIIINIYINILFNFASRYSPTRIIYSDRADAFYRRRLFSLVVFFFSFCVSYSLCRHRCYRAGIQLQCNIRYRYDI